MLLLAKTNMQLQYFVGRFLFIWKKVNTYSFWKMCQESLLVTCRAYILNIYCVLYSIIKKSHWAYRRLILTIILSGRVMLTQLLNNYSCATQNVKVFAKKIFSLYFSSMKFHNTFFNKTFILYVSTGKFPILYL